MTTRRNVLALFGGLPLLAPAASARATPPAPSLDDLVRDPQTLVASMSPNGKQIAVLMQQGKDKERLAFLHLIDADAPDAPPKQVVLGEYLVDRLFWANDQRLLVSFVVERTAEYVPTGSRIGKSYDKSFRRMMSLRADGTDPVLLFGEQQAFQRGNYDLGRVVDLLAEDDDRILMSVYENGGYVLTLHYVDVNTGRATLLERGLSNTIHWSVQQGQPVLRYDISETGAVTMVMGRAPGESRYKLVRRIQTRTELIRPYFDIIGATEEPGVFHVVTRAEDDEAPVLRKFDVRSARLGEVVAAKPDRDIEGALTDDLGYFVAANYVEDRIAYVFADKKFAAHFRAMESFFAKKYNVELYQTNRDHTRYLACVSGPGMHSAFYFYDSVAMRFQILGLGKPWLDANALAQMETLTVKARDGLTIQAYLTVPNNAGPRPLIVMPHGGPQARDQVAFDTMAQAFAAEGWYVLQPNFRGSAGYGRAFVEAGHGHWGDQMQEDVEDAVAQLLATGRIDSNKVAICGTSYGGYAALMGAVRKPDLYKAAVSIAGVSDLPRSLADSKRDDDSEDEVVYKLWIARIGDPKTDIDKLRAASPAMRAEEINAPVLLIHGKDDEVVPPRQSEIMAAALKSAHKSYEYVEVKDAGHGGLDADQMKLIYGKAIDFISKAFA